MLPAALLLCRLISSWCGCGSAGRRRQGGEDPRSSFGAGSFVGLGGFPVSGGGGRSRFVFPLSCGRGDVLRLRSSAVVLTAAGCLFCACASGLSLVSWVVLAWLKRLTTIPRRLLLCFISAKEWELSVFPVCGSWFPAVGCLPAAADSHSDASRGGGCRWSISGVDAVRQVRAVGLCGLTCVGPHRRWRLERAAAGNKRWRRRGGWRRS